MPDVGDRTDTLVSPQVQEQQCRKWAAREQLVVVGKIVTDLNKSGRSSAARQIDACIDRMRTGAVDGILVWKVDRWGRNLVDSLRNIQRLRDAGGFIASATENLDALHTSMGTFSLVTMLALAEFQSDQISDTWRDVHAHRLEQGLPQNGGRRFGYIRTRQPDGAESYPPDPVTGPQLRRCYEQFVAGMSARAITRKLTEAGVPALNGGHWTPTSLLRILDSGFGAGLLVNHDANSAPGTEDGGFLPGAHEPVIDVKLWDAYRAARESKRPPRRLPREIARLDGLLRCGSCGRKLVPFIGVLTSAGTRHQGYECRTDSPANPCATPVSVRTHIAEAATRNWLLSGSLGSDESGKFARGREICEHLANRRTRVEQILGEARTGRSALMTAFLKADGENADAEKQLFADWKTHSHRIEKIERLLATVERREDAHPVRSGERFSSVLQSWDTDAPARASRRAHALIAEVRVHRSGSTAARAEGRIAVIGQ